MAAKRPRGIESFIFGHVVESWDLQHRQSIDRYDAGGRLVSVEGPESRSYAYLNTGLVSVAKTFGGGLTGTQTREATYGYDGAGRKTLETGKVYQAGAWITTETATAAYDVLGRLTTWDEAGSSAPTAAHINWTYDAAGNVRSEVATYRALDKFGVASGTATTSSTWYV